MINFGSIEKKKTLGARVQTGRRVLLLAALLSPAAAAWAGLILQQPEFHVANLVVGRVYTASRDILMSPLTMVNETKDTLDFSLQAYVPTPDQLREGAEAIPDASWLTFARECFTMAPGQAGKTDFYVSIPNDKSLVGRKFQVQFVAQTIGSDGGGFIRLGLGGRAFFTVYDKEMPWSPEEKKAHQFGAVFRLDPDFIRAEDAPLGKKMDLKELAGGPVMLRNDGDYPVTLSLKVGQVKDAYVRAPGGFNPSPDLKALKLKTRKLVIPPHDAREIQGTFFLPDTEQNRGKGFYWVILVDSKDKKAPVEKYERVFVRTHKPS